MKIGNIFKVQKLIKIPGKSSFEDITLQEVGLMIEADSALSEKGNDSFSNRALDEFLHGTNLERPDLVNIRDRILEGIYIDVPGSRQKDIDVKFLKKIAMELRSK